ncbi:Mycobacterium numidiamassiliense ORFan [Mycobacterium numidiamassiliense]|uniref:Mycobacterium numidiamassiliense ORFan n=1 Tax=Mycobacterium numidiamassiliense TaxID=1841861 RepID=A0A2U3PFH0_9MYCO|nr:Mycobacterium numidiamassiliense ORFan [Mycobacterium numidiamassiliense]
MGDRNCNFSSFRIVVNDDVVCHSDQSVSVECTDSTMTLCGLSHLADELVEINLVQRKEAEVSVIVAEMLMERHRRFCVFGAEGTQRYEPTVEQLSCSRDSH